MNFNKELVDILIIMGNTNPCSNCMKTNSQVDLSNETNNNQPKAKKNIEHFNPINMFTKGI